MNLLLLSQNLSGSVYSETMSGGVYGGGTDVDLIAHDPMISPAGVLGGGADVDRATFNPILVPAGLLGDSAAIDRETNNPVIAPAGGWCNGGTTFTYNLSTSGGIFGGGADIEMVTYLPAVAAAGVLSGGAFTVLASYGPSTSGSGVLATGFADVSLQIPPGDQFVFDELGFGGVVVAGSGPESYKFGPRIYPRITFRVNLDFTATLGEPASTYSQSALGLQTIAIPGVGRVGHGDEFILNGVEADYVRRNYQKVGRLPGDPRSTLEVLKVE